MIDDDTFRDDCVYCGKKKLLNEHFHCCDECAKERGMIKDAAK